MHGHAHLTGVGSIYEVLARASSRPRYAFLVLQLVSEIADGQGQAGPYVTRNDKPMLLRDWLCTQLLPLSEQGARRAALRARVTIALQDRLVGDVGHDAALVGSAVDDQVLAVGRANVSRAISDLARAGLVTRHYAGYATNHRNRGGGRHAVYVIAPAVLRLLRKPAWSAEGSMAMGKPQGELFAL